MFEATGALMKAMQFYNEYVGSYAIMLLLVPAGLFFTIALKFVQVTHFKHAINVIRGKFDHQEDAGEISHFRALTTALSATVGTGNIVGVSLAIYWGGPRRCFLDVGNRFFGNGNEVCRLYTFSPLPSRS